MKEFRKFFVPLPTDSYIIHYSLCHKRLKTKLNTSVIFISESARRFGLSAVQAYRYLNRYKAIDFLDEQYNVAHTQSFEDMVQNMASYCQRHGGALA